MHTQTVPIESSLHWRPLVWAFASGAVFAVGLVLSGMTQPAKVLAFLNFWGVAQGISSQAEPGQWDPSLAFVMAAAVAVSLASFRWTPSLSKPLAALRFSLPTRTDIDLRLVLGAVLFGVGWGLVGYCPGPALASVLHGGVSVGLFVAAMLLGMLLAERLQR